MTAYLLILALLLGLAPGFIAHGKGRNFLFWWIYGVVLGPVALLHSIMLRGGQPPALDAAPGRERAPSDSPWPLLLRVASLFAIAIVAVAAYRIVIPSGGGAPAAPREVAVSSDRTPPEQTAAASGAPLDARPSAAAPANEPAAVAPPPARPSPTVRVTIRQDRVSGDDVAEKQAAPAKPEPSERFAPGTPDKVPTPPKAPAAQQLERTLPLEPKAATKSAPARVKDVSVLNARTAPPEPTEPAATAQKEVSKTARKEARQATSPKASDRRSTVTRVAVAPATAIPADKPSRSDVTAVGETVRSVQRALAARGYDPGPANGRAGRETENAIRRFQADRGLNPTGEIEYAVLEALQIVGPKVHAFQPPAGATPGR